MRRDVVVVSVWLFVCGIYSAVQASDPPPEIERRVLDSRRNIASGSMVLRSETLWGPKRSTVEYKVVFDGERLRSDRSIVGYSNGNIAFEETGKFVFTPNEFIFHSDDVTLNEAKLAVVMGDRERAGTYEMKVFHPRILGLVPSSVAVLHDANLGDFVARSDRSQVSSREELLDGKKCVRIEFQTNLEQSGRMWISADEGPSLIRAEMELKAKDGLVMDSIEVKIQRCEGDVWFPSSVAYKRRLNGDVLIHETVLVEDARFGIQVDPVNFELAGMAIPADTSILERPPRSKHSRVWDGEKAVTATVPYEDFPESAEGTSLRWWLTSVNLMILSFLAFLWWTKRVREKK